MCDFDGTLSPIVSDSTKARMNEQTHHALARMAACVPVAIITGRVLSDIRRRVRIPEVSFAGNHGFEWIIRGKAGRAKRSAALKPMRARLRLIAKRFSGTFMEDKGYTLSLHYRHASKQTHTAIQRNVRAAARETGGIRVVGGVLVDNILPTEGHDKGVAAEMMFRALARTKTAMPIFLGDDATDEDAFKVLRRGITVRIGTGKTAARYFLRTQRDVTAFLRNLAEAC